MKYIPALVSIFIAHLAGIIGSIFTTSSIDGWYATLTRPTWNPPNWVFGPVWLTLYTLMGIAAYLVWQKRKTHTLAKLALGVYGAHLVANALWSILFFGMQNPQIAFFEIIMLDILIALTMALFCRISKTAGLLLLPYMGWALFASYLNYTIWMLN